MNLLVRLLKILAWGGVGPRLGLFDTSVVQLRVWPNDLDLNGHMNNGRYLAMMDLGRLDLTLRVGLGGLMVKNRWRPLLGAATVRFRRSLMPFQVYALHTRLVGWNEKWFFMEQRFVRDEQVVARATVQALLRGPGGNVPPAEAIAAVAGPQASPPLPSSVSTWLQAEPA